MTVEDLLNSQKTIREQILEMSFNYDVRYPCFTCKDRSKCLSCEFDHSFYPSMVSNCPRKNAYIWLAGFKEIEDEEIRKIAYEGTLTHLAVINFLLVHGFVVEGEKRLRVKYENFEISGKIDAIIDDYTILEIKTVNEDRINFLKKPRFKDVQQANLYLFLLGEPYKFAEILYIPRGLFNQIEENQFYHIDEYIANSVSSWKDFIIELDSKQALKDLENFKLVREAILNNELPERRVSKECQWCDFRSICLK